MYEDFERDREEIKSHRQQARIFARDAAFLGAISVMSMSLTVINHESVLAPVTTAGAAIGTYAAIYRAYQAIEVNSQANALQIIQAQKTQMQIAELQSE